MKKIFILNVIIVSIVFAQWHTPENVSNSNGNSYLGHSAGWTVACDTNNNVHITWYTENDSPGIKYMLVPASTHKSGTVENVETGPNYLHPSIAVDSNNLPYVTWFHNDNSDDNRIKYKVKNGSWPSNQDVMNGLNPAIAVSQSGNAYIVSHDNYHFYYRTNQGGTWDSIKTMNPEPDSYYPKFPPTVVYNENTKDVFIAGYSVSDHSGSPDHEWLLLYRIPHGTDSLSGPVYAADSAGGAYLSMVIENNNIHIFYEHSLGHHYVYHVVSSDNGVTWSSPEQISSNDPESKISATVSSSGNIWVVWDDSYPYLYYNVYDAATSSWLGEQKIIYDSEEVHGHYPSLTSDRDGNIHVVYEHNNDIYYIWYTNSSAVGKREKTSEEMVILKDDKLFYNTGNRTKGKLSIYDVTGTEILKRNVINRGQLDISNLSQGIYFIKFIIGHNTYIHKITVVK